MENTTAEIYVNVPQAEIVQNDYENMSAQGVSQHEQLVENNITMANNWIGIAGDYFLFAGNTISAYWMAIYKFYERSGELLNALQVEFKDIDEMLKKDINLQEQ